MKSALNNAKITRIMNVEKYENQNYIVEKILAKNQINETDYYLIKWKNYNENENIWKSIKYFEKIQQMLKSFFQCQDSLRNHQINEKNNIHIDFKN